MTTSFKIYLEKYSNGDVEQNFYLYNTLSRGPKAIPVESPKPPSNPYLVVKYSDPILKKHELSKNDIDDDYIDKEQSDDDGDDPHRSNYPSFDFTDTDMLDLSDLLGGTDLDFPVDRLSDANLLSDDLLNEEYFRREESFSRIKKNSEQPDICGFKISSDLNSLLKMDITPINKTPDIFSLRNDNISIKNSFESNEENAMFIRISCEAGPSTSSRERIRRSELNDLKPDPKKLLEIGYQINRMFEQYNDSSNSHEHLSNLPIKKSSKNKKPAFKRLKSQLGSRICRLKKKASVEANKIFFDALQREQENLLVVMKTMLETLFAEVGDNNPSSSDHLSRLNSLIQEHLDDMAAGYRTGCVRKILVSEAKRILSENNETFLSDSE